MSADGTSTRGLVPLDLLSALIDSRTGGSTLLSQLAREPTWSVSGEAVYSAWHSTNKELQRQCRTWTPFRSSRGVPATSVGHCAR
jgi:hypothetical protein